MSGFFELPTIKQPHPAWSDPRVVVLSAEDAEELSSQINCLLASDDFHVLALSAATSTATFVEEPFIATLVLQERTDPLVGGKP
jgi:hypothetical protein